MVELVGRHRVSPLRRRRGSLGTACESGQRNVPAWPSVHRHRGIDRLFREYKEWLKEKNAVERLNVLASLKDLAEVYASLPTAEDYGELRFSDHEKRFFYVVDTLNITTAYPLILFLYQNFEDQERMLQLRTLESYLVRRNVCRFTTKNYNNLFLSLLQKLDEEKETGKLTTQSMMKILLELKEATNLFPSDEEFRKAFSASLLSNQNARTILVCLALYQQDSELHDQPMLAPGSMSVEHIMPRKWESHWSEGKMNALARQERERKILTLGNLTLVRKRLNSKLQNDSWVVKRETLRKYSSLGMTTSYLSLPKWGEEAIEARAEDLSRVALEIWSR